jgi:hypothetical protein
VGQIPAEKLDTSTAATSCSAPNSVSRRQASTAGLSTDNIYFKDSNK